MNRSPTISTSASIHARPITSHSEAQRMTALLQPVPGKLSGADRGLAQTRENTLLRRTLRDKQDCAAILR
ncbi:hypothetical protein [Collimonas sp.]|uniref:hypothetical protein n=1 Tax=Collimonas sp. TaxID=1963772 RepID=UPI0037BE5E64